MALAATSPLLHLLLRPSSATSQFFSPPLYNRTKAFFSRSLCCHSISNTSAAQQPLNPIADADSTQPFPHFPSPAPPNLTVREKKELASYAHSLGKKLKSQQVGKSGVTPAVAASFVETLEANELLKLKVHNSCPGEFVDVVKQLEEATGSIAVGQIGRSVILYRPSLTKMKEAERKKQQVQRVRKGFTLKASELEDQVSRLSSRGRRGSSRVQVK